MLLFCRSSLVVTVASTALACANGEELAPRYDNSGASDTQVPANGGKGASGAESARGGAGSGGKTPAPSGGTRASGGVVGSGGASRGGSSAIGGRPSSGGSGADGAAGAVMDGSAGMVVSGGAAGASMGGSGGQPACGTNQKRCNGACVQQTPLNGCDGITCTACPGPAPAFGSLTCNPTGECAFDCLPGFKIDGNGCALSTGAGGSAGVGAGGSVTCGITNCTPCPPPHITCCERTTGNACLCAPPDYASSLCR